jgi:poly-gamma-glutamate synthesis protein (capsule biosynthesis protein)
MEIVRQLGRAINWDVELGRRRSLADKIPDHGSDAYDLLGQTFVRGETLGFKRYAEESDIVENVRQVRYAKEMADRVIVSMHTHDLGGPSYLSGRREDPPEFMVDFAKRSIDAGADVFVGHGGPALGIELYQGRPIFYGLSTFIGQLETVRFLPEQAYERYGLGPDATPDDFVKNRYEHRDGGAGRADRGGAFAVCDFDGPSVREIRLYPFQLGGAAQTRAQRGRPMLAESGVGQKSIEHIRRLSARYGTEVAYEDGIGIIRP